MAYQLKPSDYLHSIAQAEKVPRGSVLGTTACGRAKRSAGEASAPGPSRSMRRWRSARANGPARTWMGTSSTKVEHDRDQLEYQERYGAVGLLHVIVGWPGITRGRVFFIACRLQRSLHWILGHGPPSIDGSSFLES